MYKPDPITVSILDTVPTLTFRNNEQPKVRQETLEHALRNTKASLQRRPPLPAAACGQCGGWSSVGGMSQYRNAVEPVMGRVGCSCHGGAC